jgi:brefeldin A-inhibited guanine nucleotide-exchange protein
LKAVRQIYNIFLLSKSSANQQIAQGTLTQMVGTVFERVKTRIRTKEARTSMSNLHIEKETENSSDAALENGSIAVDGASSVNGGAEGSLEDASGPTLDEMGKHDGGEKLTLQSFENRKSFDDTRITDNAPTMVTQLKQSPKSPDSLAGSNPPDINTEDGEDAEDAEDEVFIRDAYLVFRSFCNLSTKVMPSDQLHDLKSHSMRSKLISLHIIHTLLSNNILVFTSPLCTIRNSKSNEPTGFLQAIKFYLCLSVTRNGASSQDRVFEVTCEIFWLMLKHMRGPFKVSQMGPFECIIAN